LNEIFFAVIGPAKKTFMGSFPEYLPGNFSSYTPGKSGGTGLQPMMQTALHNQEYQ
jgi:hypothetical protein